MLVLLVSNFTDYTSFKPIEYFILLLPKPQRWFASWIQFFGLLLKGLGRESLCSLYLGLNVFMVKPMKIYSRR